VTHRHLSELYRHGVRRTNCPARVVDLGGAYEVVRYSPAGGVVEIARASYYRCPACSVAFRLCGTSIMEFPHEVRKPKGMT